MQANIYTSGWDVNHELHCSRFEFSQGPLLHMSPTHFL